MVGSSRMTRSAGGAQARPHLQQLELASAHAIDAPLDERPDRRGHGPFVGADEAQEIHPGKRHLRKAYRMLALHVDPESRAPVQLPFQNSSCPDNCVDQRRLAGAIGSGEADDLPAKHGKRDWADDRLGVAGDNAVELEQRRVGVTERHGPAR